MCIRYFTYLLFGVLLFSCAKKEVGTSTKIKISIDGFAAILGTKANNGMFLYGKTVDGTKTFTKLINTDSIDLVFPNGTWNFYAVSWETGSPSALPNFTGKTYCGKSLKQNLIGSDYTISMDITNSGCSDADFSSASSTYGGDVVLPKPQIQTCKNLALITGSSSTCNQTNENNGYAVSYKIVAYENANFGANTASKKIAESSCLRANFTDSVGGLDTTDSTLRDSIRLK